MPPAGAPGAARRRRLVLGVTVVVHLVVLYWPTVGDGSGLPGLDKAVHLLVFAAVAWAGHRAGLPTGPLVAVLLAHAVVSEAVQHLALPGRGGDPWDALADAVGTVVGVVVAQQSGRLRRRAE